LLGEDYKYFKIFATIKVVLLRQITPQKWTDVFFTNISIRLARMEDKRGAYRVLVGTLRERHHLEDPGRIILK